VKCHSLLSSVTLTGAPFFRPVNRTADEPPVQCREQLSVTDGQILISLIPLFTVLPSSLHELHDRGRALGFKMKPYSSPLSPDGWKLLWSHCGQHQFLFRNKTNDGSPTGFSAGKVRRPLASRAQVNNGAWRQPCAQASASCESLPNCRSRRRDCDLQGQNSVGSSLSCDSFRILAEGDCGYRQ